MQQDQLGWAWVVEAAEEKYYFSSFFNLFFVSVFTLGRLFYLPCFVRPVHLGRLSKTI